MRVTELLTNENITFAVVDTAQIRFDPMFRELCQKNTCGFYGACWTCPPDAGTIEELMEQAKQHTHTLVFQTVHPLEDSFDIEGMHEASVKHNRLVQAVNSAARAEYPGCLVLGAGTCGVCARCTKPDGEPCRFPEKAVVSLEACGIDVAQLAKAAGLKYINGVNTVTYFGAVLFD